MEDFQRDTITALARIEERLKTIPDTLKDHGQRIEKTERALFRLGAMGAAVAAALAYAGHGIGAAVKAAVSVITQSGT